MRRGEEVTLGGQLALLIALGGGKGVGGQGKHVLVTNCIHVYAVFPLYRSCGTFSYRERLQQQNGDMRKRDKAETRCTWLHLVQGHICSPSLLLTPPPPFSLPPINAITGQPACALIPIPPPPHPPPMRIMARSWQPHPKTRMASI